MLGMISRKGLVGLSQIPHVDHDQIKYKKAMTIPKTYWLEEEHEIMPPNDALVGFKVRGSYLLAMSSGGFNFNQKSFKLTSATFVTAILNLTPAITFVLAVSFGLEKLNLGTATGKAKVAGTIIGIGGAMLMTFHLCSVAKMSRDAKEYPSHHTNTVLMSLMAAIQSTVFAVCIERDWKQWKLGWNIRLLTVTYLGIVTSALMVIAIAWIVEMRGPLFVSIFCPLKVLFVTIAAFLFWEEKLYLRSVLGAVLIVCSLYMVLWAKGEETKQRIQQLASQKSQAQSVDGETQHSSAYLITKDNEDSSKSGRDEQHMQGREKEDKIALDNVV